jgi:hypothetical protein
MLARAAPNGTMAPVSGEVCHPTRCSTELPVLDRKVPELPQRARGYRLSPDMRPLLMFELDAELLSSEPPEEADRFVYGPIDLRIATCDGDVLDPNEAIGRRAE